MYSRSSLPWEQMGKISANFEASAGNIQYLPKWVIWIVFHLSNAFIIISQQITLPYFTNEEINEKSIQYDLLENVHNKF